MARGRPYRRGPDGPRQKEAEVGSAAEAAAGDAGNELVKGVQQDRSSDRAESGGLAGRPRVVDVIRCEAGLTPGFANHPEGMVHPWVTAGHEQRASFVRVKPGRRIDPGGECSQTKAEGFRGDASVVHHL